MQGYFLGVDTGGTKTHAMLATAAGEVVGLGEGGCGNHENVGYDGLIRVLDETVSQALARAGIRKGEILAAGFGVAGYDWPSERQPTLDAIAALGLACPVEAVNDTIVGLVAGSSSGWGLVIDAGTGNNVRGRDPAGREVQVTGCGLNFGEYGGAYDIVMRAVQVVSYEWYGRGPHTALTQALIERTGAKDLFDLMEGLSLGYYDLDSGMAPLVFEIASRGDAVAQEAIRWLAVEQAETACGVIRKLHFEDIEFECVLIGSTFNGGALYLNPLKETIWKTAPRARFIRLEAPPVVGGVLLAMELVGLKDPGVRQRLINRTKTLP